METILQLVWACLGPSGALHTPFDNMILHALQRCTMRQPEATRRCFRHRTAFPQHSLLLQAHKSCSTRADIHTKAARRATAATETAVGQNGAPPAAVPAAAPGANMTSRIREFVARLLYRRIQVDCFLLKMFSSWLKKAVVLIYISRFWSKHDCLRCR